MNKLVYIIVFSFNSLLICWC